MNERFYEDRQFEDLENRIKQYDGEGERITFSGAYINSSRDARLLEKKALLFLNPREIDSIGHNIDDNRGYGYNRTTYITGKTKVKLAKEEISYSDGFMLIKYTLFPSSEDF